MRWLTPVIARWQQGGECEPTRRHFQRPVPVEPAALPEDCEQGQLPQLGFQRHSVLENTIKIAETVVRLRAQGEDISDEKLSHVSLLPFRHVLPNGTYFIENS